MTAKDMPHVGKAAGGRGRRAARRKPPGGSGGPPYTRSWLYPKQREAIFCKQRYAIVEASTKSGKTVGCMVWLLDQAWPERSRNVPKAATSTGARREEEAPGQPPAPVRNYWWVAPVTAQAKIAYRRLKRVLPRGAFTAKETELTITLANESVVWFKGADDPDHLYGEDVYAAVIDEATRCKEEAWHAVRSTLTATRGPVRIIGNVKGTRNWAFRLARRAEAGERGMHYAKITAHDAVAAGKLARVEVEDARRTLPESVFRQLYLAEPADDEGNPFGITAVRGCVEGALSDGEPVVWGWDLAKSVDWTVGIGLDAEGRVSRFERFRRPWAETVARIREVTGATPTLVDSTGVGDPILEALQRGGTGNDLGGYHFTSESKQQLMEGLALAIQRGDVAFPDGPIVNELEAFEYEFTRTGVRYTAPEGMHDDCVCALALAVRRRGLRPGVANLRFL